MSNSRTLSDFVGSSGTPTFSSNTTFLANVAVAGQLTVSSNTTIAANSILLPGNSAIVNSVANTGLLGVGVTSPARAIHVYSPTTSAEQIWEMGGAQANGRKWNLVVDGGTNTSPNSLTFRILGDDGVGNNTIGFGVNGSTGVFATSGGRKISPGSVPVGSVIQTQWTNLGTGAYSGTSASAVNTGFSTTFTPQYNTSKVLHIVTIGMFLVCDGNIFIARNGSIVSPSLCDSYRDVPSTGSQVNDMPPFTFTYLDSPATTSAITYTLWAAAPGCGHTIFVGSSSDFSASWLTMEIAA